MKTSTKFLMISAILLAFIFMYGMQSGTACTPVPKESYSLSDDAGHYAAFINSHQSIANPSLYSEW